MATFEGFCGLLFFRSLFWPKERSSSCQLACCKSCACWRLAATATAADVEYKCKRVDSQKLVPCSCCSPGPFAFQSPVLELNSFCCISFRSCVFLDFPLALARRVCSSFCGTSQGRKTKIQKLRAETIGRVFWFQLSSFYLMSRSAARPREREPFSIFHSQA